MSPPIGGKMKQYSTKFKEEVVKKKLSGGNVREIADDRGIAYATVYQWVREFQEKGNNPEIKTPKAYNIEEKYDLILEYKNVSTRKIGEWLRLKGLHSEHFDKWNNEVKTHMKKPDSLKAENKQLKEDMKKLQKELLKKDKALAEAAAVLVLKKKYQHLWEDEE